MMEGYTPSYVIRPPSLNPPHGGTGTVRLAERATSSLFWGFTLLLVMWFVIGVCYWDATILRMACACSVLNLLVAFNLNTIRKWFMTHWV